MPSTEPAGVNLVFSFEKVSC